jgi:hypothetical protein
MARHVPFTFEDLSFKSAPSIWSGYIKQTLSYNYQGFWGVCEGEQCHDYLRQLHYHIVHQTLDFLRNLLLLRFGPSRRCSGPHVLHVHSGLLLPMFLAPL